MLQAGQSLLSHIPTIGGWGGLEGMHFKFLVLHVQSHVSILVSLLS